MLSRGSTSSQHKLSVFLPLSYSVLDAILLDLLLVPHSRSLYPPDSELLMSPNSNDTSPHWTLPCDSDGECCGVDVWDDIDIVLLPIPISLGGEDG